jgi:tetratricopeptide (TPR) repeat protein
VKADGGDKLFGAYLTELGFVRQMQGHLLEAREHYEEALRLFQAVGAINVGNQLLSTIVDLRWALGDIDGAIEAAKETITVWRNGPWRTVFGYDIINLAGIYIERGDLELGMAAARSPEGLAFPRDRGVLWMFWTISRCLPRGAASSKSPPASKALPSMGTAQAIRCASPTSCGRTRASWTCCARAWRLNGSRRFWTKARGSTRKAPAVSRSRTEL